MRKRRQAPAPPKPYRILAQDGDDDDGGTMYYLFDDLNRVVAASAWPQPLENIAYQIGGHPTLRITCTEGARVDDD